MGDRSVQSRRSFWRGRINRLAAEGKTALLLVWDNASWHISQAGAEAWLKAQQQSARQAGRRLSRGRVPIADKESLAQSDPAQIGPWQACNC